MMTPEKVETLFNNMTPEEQLDQIKNASFDKENILHQLDRPTLLSLLHRTFVASLEEAREEAEEEADLECERKLSDAYDDGHSEGYDDGYDDGHQAGFQEAEAAYIDGK